MKTKTSPENVRAFVITGIAGLDPIHVVAREDSADGFFKATLIVQCFDRAWTCYWGSMGDSLENFLNSVDADYIAENLIRGTRHTLEEEWFDNDFRYLTEIADAIKDAVKNGALSDLREAA